MIEFPPDEALPDQDKWVNPHRAAYLTAIENMIQEIAEKYNYTLPNNKELLSCLKNHLKELQELSETTSEDEWGKGRAEMQKKVLETANRFRLQDLTVAGTLVRGTWTTQVL